VAKSGHTLDMLDLPGRTAKRGRRTRIRGWIGVVIATAIAGTTAVFAVTGALALVTDQGDQNAYDKAPYCAGQSAQTQNCVLRSTASVGYAYASKNTGKGAHGYTTHADLDPVTGQEQEVTLSTSQDLTYEVHDGDQMPVLVWRDQITRFTFQGSTRDADENPHHIVASDLTQVTMCLLAAVVFGRPLIRRALRTRIAINLRRNRLPDWTLLFLAVATPIAALLRASYPVSVFGLAGIAVLLLSAVWPFVPWVATFTDEQRPYVPGERAQARKIRKQNEARQNKVRQRRLP
jgi:hypothetical protein